MGDEILIGGEDMDMQSLKEVLATQRKKVWLGSEAVQQYGVWLSIRQISRLFRDRANWGGAEKAMKSGQSGRKSVVDYMHACMHGNLVC